MNNVTFGNERHQYYETVASGSGAGDGFHGAPVVQTHMTNSRLTDPEVLEWRLPVLLEEFAVRRGSGGPGTVARRRRRRTPHPLPRTHDCVHPLAAPQGPAVRHGGRRARGPSAPTAWSAPTARSTELAGSDSADVRPRRRTRHRNPRRRRIRSAAVR